MSKAALNVYQPDHFHGSCSDVSLVNRAATYLSWFSDKALHRISRAVQSHPQLAYTGVTLAKKLKSRELQRCMPAEDITQRFYQI